MVERAVIAVEAYQNVIARLGRRLGAKIADLKTLGFVVLQYEREQALKALSECPLHLGSKSGHSQPGA